MTFKHTPSQLTWQPVSIGELLVVTPASEALSAFLDHLPKLQLYPGMQAPSRVSGLPKQLKHTEHLSVRF